MNEIIEKENIIIEDMIYEVRGKQVMLDSDIAKLYQVETKRINELFDKFDPKDIVKDYIFFESDFYDSYSLLLDIFNNAREEIIIIDNCAGKELLDILREIDKKIIVSKNIDTILKRKYESQYDNISFISNKSFHYRFIILDRTKLYSCGASFKDLGKKCFAINEFYDNEYVKQILNTLEVITNFDCKYISE